MVYTLGRLASETGATLNDESFAATEIFSVAPVQHASSGQISFISNPKYKKYLLETHASCVIVTEALAADSPVPVLVSSNPYVTYARIAALLSPVIVPAPSIHVSAVVADTAKVDKTAFIGPNAVIDESAIIGAGCFIGAGCYIGPRVTIGDATRVNANVSVYNDCQIGKRNIIHSGAVIGADGFGFANDSGHWVKVPQTGAVIIGDDVEIGASTTIDRGALDNTVIEDGVKLDNQIQIAHNVRIGAHTAIAGCSGVAGSTVIGKNCTIAGMCTIVGHIELADNVHVTAMSLITKSITRAGSYSSGTPFEETANWRKNSVRFRQLDDISRRLSRLEKKL
jgi:UDP-3-O-[3-hydroxymyristoyl] glucosamine N-acyltransferase